MTPLQYQSKIQAANPAEARVGGVLRGGWFDGLKRVFFYCGKGFHGVPEASVRDLRVLGRKIEEKT